MIENYKKVLNLDNEGLRDLATDKKPVCRKEDKYPYYILT